MARSDRAGAVRAPRETGAQAKTVTRCSWAESNERMIRYHDEEWGLPVFDDRRLFEFLVLDGFQAGLSWATILNKRENFRRAFDDFDPEKVARFTSRRVHRLLADPGIVRNRQKILATIENARAFLRVQEERGSFADLVWEFVGGAPKQNARRTLRQIPARTRESDRMSQALRGLGFAFVGSTICYAFMQAAGLVNDHLVTCFRHEAVRRAAGTRDRGGDRR